MYSEDEKILKAFKREDQVIMKAFYDNQKEAFLSFIMGKFSMSADHAAILFQDSFTTLYLNIRKGSLELPLKSSLRTYLFSLGKYKALNNIRNQKNKSFVDEIPDEAVLPQVERMLEIEETKKKTKALLERIGEPCRKLLTYLFIEEKDYEEVGRLLGIEKSGTLRKRKFDCLKKMRALL